MSRRFFASLVWIGVCLGGLFAFRAGAASVGSLCLNEAVSFNDAGLADEDGDHPEWIELFNLRARAIEFFQVSQGRYYPDVINRRV